MTPIRPTLVALLAWFEVLEIVGNDVRVLRVPTEETTTAPVP